MTLMQEMSQRALELGVPVSVHFDITYRCNERCVHCYLDHDDHGEMTTAEIKRVLKELADAGTFFLTFSGGEVLMRRDFFELLAYARQLMFNVRIKTNAVMIGESEARRMLELGVDQVQVSIYSHRPQVHDGITKLPGSLRRSVEAIRFLTQQGLRVVIAKCADDGQYARQRRGAGAGPRVGRGLHSGPNHHSENGRRHIHPESAHSWRGVGRSLSQ
jgi:AdoMet-dependent heme synthase